MSKLFFFAALAVILMLSSSAWSQAIVSENSETVTLYVDVANGSDANHGTLSLPFKSIKAAASAAISNKNINIGTKVIINPGLYREVLNLSGSSKQSTKPITFQAATTGTVFISGAVQSTGWSAYNGNPKLSRNVWPNQWGFCNADPAENAPFEQPVVLRREMIFVNGQMMTQVLSLTSMIYPGTAYVDETNAQVYVWPPAGVNMSTADVEVATNPLLLSITGPGAAHINGIVFRGITFEYANSCHDDAAVSVQGSATNILFDSDRFIWNGGQGLAFSYPAANVTVMNSASNHNGATGYQTFQLKNSLWQNDEASYNNWRGAQGVYYTWNTGGAHLFSDHNETINGFKANYNQTIAIHWDTDNANINTSALVAAENVIGPLFEKSQGPFTLSGSTLCSSQTRAAGYSGFTLRDSEKVTLSGNIFYNNNNAQIMVTGAPGGLASGNWETGEVYNLITSNVAITRNTIEGMAGQPLFKDSMGGSEWTQFVTTLTSNSNTWWNASVDQPFVIPYPVTGTALDFRQWQTNTSQDTNSFWSAPSVDPSTACAVTADAPDFWVITDSDQDTTDPSGQASFALNTVSLAGMTGTVTFASDGVASIPGASVTFSPASLPISGTSTLTFSAGLNTPPGTYAFVVLANSGSITRTVTLQVTVPVTAIRLSTTSLNFYNEPVGYTSPAQDLTLTNTGSTPIAMVSIVAPYGFTQSNKCGLSLAAGGSCTISVTFAPHQLSPYCGKLMINDGDPSSPQIVVLTGTTVGAPSASFSPKSLLFGSSVFGSATAPKTVILTNKGTAALNISAIGFIGDNVGDFSQTNSCGSILAQGASCTFAITFHPTFTGKRVAQLSVIDDAIDSPQTVSLSGNGQVAVTVSPKAISFGTIKVGNAYTRVATIKNASTAAMSIASMVLSGANSGDFSKVDTCGGSVAALSNCTVTLTFSPKAVGARSATETITDADPTSPQMIALTGIGR